MTLLQTAERDFEVAEWRKELGQSYSYWETAMWMALFEYHYRRS